MPASTNPFDGSARNWDQRRMSVQLAEVENLLLPLLVLNDQQHWLDFGSGTGLLSVPLAARVGRVTALDTSANMLEVLDEKGVSNIETHNQNVFAGLPCDYDGVVSCMALH
ncbi:MAG: class I SAM-dependent methyltransferase, partial [Pseudomonadaceae bacterium]|nr:class I SAM-dependent methyltransferase [Pseudomonadaceae bacterium]